jgi:hypothetical protein
MVPKALPNPPTALQLVEKELGFRICDLQLTVPNDSDHALGVKPVGDGAQERTNMGILGLLEGAAPDQLPSTRMGRLDRRPQKRYAETT